MKKLVIFASVAMMAASSMAQGVLDFNTVIAGSPRITDNNGVNLSGSAYNVDLFYGPVGGDPTTFTSLGLAVPFNTGAQAGMFAGGTQAIPGFAPGSQVAIQPRAWRVSDGSSWAAAFANAGMVSPPNAAPVTVTLQSPVGSPPPTPPKLTGYVGHSLIIVPEPSTVLLGLSGLLGLFFLRRKVS